MTTNSQLAQPLALRAAHALVFTLRCEGSVLRSTTLRALSCTASRSEDSFFPFDFQLSTVNLFQ